MSRRGEVACRLTGLTQLQSKRSGSVGIFFFVVLIVPLVIALEGCNHAAKSAGESTLTATSNRLIHESSPYLREHAHDPVDWYPWGEEAFTKAKKEDKPIFLSIGYSACHWCHVMQKESFQDREIAKFLNENFVCIKVDREERPDVDEVYMTAVQIINGSGGWPMTVFLTPEKKPFFAGTYFPPQDDRGLTGLPRVLAAVNDSWRKHRDRISDSSKQILDLISRSETDHTVQKGANVSTVTSAVDKLLAMSDRQWGGLGNSPKFPTPGAIQVLLRQMTAAKLQTKQGRDCSEFVSRTLEKMSQGGIYDHLGGGFCRYSTDQKWHIPHFEKMLYDNALLSDVYLDGFLISRNSDWAQTARETLDFVIRDFSAPDGGFYSSLDADSDGKEGLYYLFSMQEIRKSFSSTDAELIAELFSLSEEGNFSNGYNVLYLSDTAGLLSKRHGMSDMQFKERIRPLKETLRQLRAGKSAPKRDEKIITSWNSLMISSLVHGYKVLGDEKYLVAAKRCAHFLLSEMHKDNRMYRIWASGKAKEGACLDDYAHFVQALLDLGMIDSSDQWLAYAQEINQWILRDFQDKRNGGFFYTAEFQNQPLIRTKSKHDSVTPSGTATEIDNLIRLSELTGREDLKRIAGNTLELYGKEMLENPIVHAFMLCALDRYLQTKSQIVLLSPQKTSSAIQVEKSLYGQYMPNVTLVVRISGSGKSEPLILNGKTSKDGRPTVFVCHGHTCDAPITELSQINDKLRSLLSEAGTSQMKAR